MAKLPLDSLIMQTCGRIISKIFKNFFTVHVEDRCFQITGLAFPDSTLAFSIQISPLGGTNYPLN